MRNNRSYWQSYWRGLDDPKHRHSTDEWLRFYAQELQLYFPEEPAKVLELGCGNGDLYDFFVQCFSGYVGVDFSEAMLASFKREHRDVSLVRADAARLPFVEDSRYDLVFSNGLCQYLGEDALRDNLVQVHRLLDSGGVYLMGNIPDSHLRLFYYAGALRGDESASWITMFRRLADVFIRKKTDGIGKWYSRHSLCRISNEMGFACETFSSSGYEYRFHAVLKKGE